MCKCLGCQCGNPYEDAVLHGEYFEILNECDVALVVFQS
jgi:hypothetical protein